VKLQVEIEPDQVRFRCTIRKTTRLHCQPQRNRSKPGERGLLFFKLLKKQDKFKWSQEAADALEDLKQHLQSPPTLTAPLPGEELFLYIAATTHIVSTAIVV